MEERKSRKFNARRISLFRYMRQLATRLAARGQVRTSETYVSTLNSFRAFRRGRDVCLKDFNSVLLQEYEAYLRSKSLSLNTISFYMRRLRAVYNRIVEEFGFEDTRPFRRVFTSTERTAKRAISIKYVKALKEMDLSRSYSKRFARDMFMFSFYTRGMSFVDIAHLRKSDICGNALIYKRSKTKQRLHIHLEQCMVDIISRYAVDGSPYLFPIIESAEGDTRKQYQTAQSLVNRRLKMLGNDLGLPMPLTMYVARHSWASIAHSEGIPISVISEGMGHDSEATTRIYLASLETSVIDNANYKILNLL